ncbi:hypothetical protein GGTG_10728 [Gaeumannomyces tritici R3-111a-1]|uniref:Heterokaryon incompatibility domain-containing protein n=1 Tax=Gaeumannomyces tritici (strain R3-111a-1) TaxID=644352 RepID=J3PB55_GAET3|nr:hypothetical protein GGTG_10728 [Gaeumannomyces tritici R3-111a-1]EJT71471.1 hypothetical protein GGTG_10728 [Gaeumannomyces tritici R3-111a-1]
MVSNPGSSVGLLDDEVAIADLASSSTLCDACRAIFSAGPKPQPSFDSPSCFVHHRSGGLASAAESGCVICKQLAPAGAGRDQGPPETQDEEVTHWELGHCELWRGRGGSVPAIPNSTNEDLFMVSIFSPAGIGKLQREVRRRLSFVIAPCKLGSVFPNHELGPCGGAMLYLWIDSLYIYQDSKADWEREAGMMGDIYGGALINIAATDAGAGCERMIPRERRAQPLLPVISSPGNAMLPERGAAVLHPHKAFFFQVLESMLMGRGWVHQEVCIAPATLYMTATQAWWRCSATTCSETYPDGIPLLLEPPLEMDHLSLLRPGATGEAPTNGGPGTATIDPDQRGLSFIDYPPINGPQRDRLAHLATPPPIGELDMFGWPLTAEDATLHLRGVLLPLFAMPHFFNRLGFQAWPRPLGDGPLPSNGRRHGVWAIFDDAQELAEVKEEVERTPGGGDEPLRGLFFLVTEYADKRFASLHGLVLRERFLPGCDGSTTGRRRIFPRAGVFFPNQCCGYPEEDPLRDATAVFDDFQMARYGRAALEAVELRPEHRALADAEATLDDIYLC